MIQNTDIHQQAIIDEKIDRYLSNQMSLQEEREFEEELRTNAELRNRARFIAQTIKALRRGEDKNEGTSQESNYRMVARNPLAKKKSQKS